MAVVSLSSFSLLILIILWTPPVQSYPDGGRKVCENMTTGTVCSKDQALLIGSLVLVTLEFNVTLSVDDKPDPVQGALTVKGLSS